MIVVLFISTFLISTACAGVVALFGSKMGLVDNPDARSSHSTPVPKGGGIGILIVFCLLAGYFTLSAFLWVPVAIVSILSFVGDRIDLSPKLRLFLQFAAAAFFIFGTLETLGNEFLQSPNIIMTVLLPVAAVVFITGTANFYNFMDGINGIAAITGLVAFGLLFSYGLAFGKNTGMTYLSVGVAAGCAGFLPWNFPAAKVFMGDVGSILLGFLFAAITVTFSESIQEFIVLTSFLFPFYIDEIVTMAERIKHKNNLLRPHRTHLYQVLANEKGIPHWAVSIGYGASQLVLGASVWFVASKHILYAVFLLTLFTILFTIVDLKVKKAHNIFV